VATSAVDDARNVRWQLLFLAESVRAGKSYRTFAACS